MTPGVSIEQWRCSAAFMVLSLEQQGAYRNLLDFAAIHGGLLPADETVLARACGDATAWPRVRAAVLAYFEACPGGYRDRLFGRVSAQREGWRRRQAKRRQLLKTCGPIVENPGRDVTRDITRDTQRDRPQPIEVVEVIGDPLQRALYSTEYKEHSGTAAATPPLFTRKEEKHQASPWKRAVAICHAVMDAHPDRRDWPEGVKARGTAQGIPIYERGGKDQRELWARALDYTDNARQVRAARAGARRGES